MQMRDGERPLGASTQLVFQEIGWRRGQGTMGLENEHLMRIASRCRRGGGNKAWQLRISSSLFKPSLLEVGELPTQDLVRDSLFSELTEQSCHIKYLVSSSTRMIL